MRVITKYCALLVTWATLNAALADPTSTATCPDADDPPLLTQEKRLMECLMKSYNKAIRPVAKYNDSLQVHVKMHLMAVEDIDEKASVMQTNGWMHEYWMDVQLKWEPSDYGGVTELRIPSDQVWKPDVVLYNTALMSHSYVMDNVVVVLSNGTVHWVPHARHTSFCRLNLKKFPFDTQSCSLLFGTWNYDMSKVELVINNHSHPEFTYDGTEWQTVSFDVARHVWGYNSKLKYTVLQYKITLKRIPTYHRQMFVFPSVVIAFLTVFMFFVPPEAGERLTLGIGIVIAITLQMLLLDQYLPTAIEAAPAILVYLTFDLVMVTFALLLSIMTLNFHHRDIRRGKVPDWIRQLFLGRLSKLLCMRGEVYSHVPANDLTSELTLEQDLTSTETPLPRSPTLALEKTLDEIRRYLKVLSTRPMTSQPMEVETPHRQLVLNEWHQLALVLDRLMFWTFLVLSVLISIIVYA